MWVKLSLKLHMNVATTFSCLFIISHKVSLSFLNLVVNTLFFGNFHSCHLFLHFFYSWKIGLFSISIFTVPFGCIILSRGHPFMTSTKNDQFFDPPYPDHLQKWTIELLFKNNRNRKHVTNFKTPPPPFRVDVINVWSLTISVKNSEISKNIVYK